VIGDGGAAFVNVANEAALDNIREISMNAALPMSLSELVHGRKRAR
jgi:hypothetical protein